MKIWTIVTPKNDYEIEISKQTLLYKQNYEWNRLTRQIDNFFNIRSTSVEIFEDGVPINKKDWKCFFIPYDANIQLSKITASSPLKEIQNDLTEYLSHLPLYQELLEIWGQLVGELDFINRKLEKWNISANLNTIDKKTLSQFINFHPTSGGELSPIEVKTLIINIILENEMDKKTLIIVELPELFATEKELENFKLMVDQAINKGYQFLFISDNKSFGVGNYFFKNKIVNSALLEQIKQNVCNEVPFYCSEDLFEEAKNVFLRLVDNSIFEADLLHLGGNNFDAIITIIHVIMYNLDMEPFQVPHGIEPNLKKFISTLH